MPPLAGARWCGSPSPSASIAPDVTDAILDPDDRWQVKQRNRGGPVEHGVGALIDDDRQVGALGDVPDVSHQSGRRGRSPGTAAAAAARRRRPRWPGGEVSGDLRPPPTRPPQAPDRLPPPPRSRDHFGVLRCRQRGELTGAAGDEQGARAGRSAARDARRTPPGRPPSSGERGQREGQQPWSCMRVLSSFGGPGGESAHELALEGQKGDHRRQRARAPTRPAAPDADLVVAAQATQGDGERVLAASWRPAAAAGTGPRS